MTEEELKKAVAKCNMDINKALEEIGKAGKTLYAYKEPFATQKALANRLDATLKAVNGILAAMDTLRPRIYMIERDPNWETPVQPARPKRGKTGKSDGNAKYMKRSGKVKHLAMRPGRMPIDKEGYSYKQPLPGNNQ